jgi:hypothetical protein
MKLFIRKKFYFHYFNLGQFQILFPLLHFETPVIYYLNSVKLYFTTTETLFYLF